MNVLNKLRPQQEDIVLYCSETTGPFSTAIELYPEMISVCSCGELLRKYAFSARVSVLIFPSSTHSHFFSTYTRKINILMYIGKAPFAPLCWLHSGAEPLVSIHRA